MPPAAKKEYTPEELDALEAQQAQRPVYDVISGGVGAAMSYYDGPQETKAEYTPEEMDVRDALYSAPELTPEELDQRTVDAKYDARVLLSPEQLKEADELEAKLTEQGKRPGKWQMAKAIGGGILQSVADWNMALDKTGNLAAVVENVLIKTGAISGDYKKIPAVEAAMQAPASAKAAVPAVALNTMETVLALNNLMKGKPRYRVQETGEFVYAPLGGVAPLTQLAGEGKTLVPVTDADLDEHRYQLYAKENAIRSTYLDIMDEKLLGVKPNQSFTLPAEILLAPENLAPGLAASRVTGAARLGKLFSAKTLGAAEAAAGGSANVIDKGADVFTRAVQKMTFGLADRKTQSKIAKAAAYGGGAGAAATMLSGAPEEARNTALALMSLYPMYKMGSGVLRRVEGAAGTAKMIMRESADATNGMDDVARAAVANNAAVPREIREALANPSKFVPLESTPARIAKNEAFSPRVREVAARLASPLIVQASRTAGAVARGAVVGPVVNIPFAEAYREIGDQQTAEGIYGAGVLFGAGGGLVGRVAGARGRRRDAAISDIGRMLVDIQQNNAGELGRPAPNRAAEVYYSMKEPGRMLTDVELAGGDIEALLRNTKFEDLAGMAAMQGFYRDSVDFIPLNGLDYDANVKALGGNGTAGYFLHAPEGQRARLFLNADARRTDVAPHEYGHALLASAAISPEMKNSARASINQRYGPEKLDAMAREYARSVVAGRNAREFPGQKIDVSETEVGSILNELTENGLARGDADRLDWLRDEIFAEEHRAAGIDYAQIRRGIPAGFNPVGFAENVLGANARALAAAGAPIDPQTGKLQAPPDRLFKDNPILAADPVMRRNIRQYVSAYQQWLNDPAHEAPVGAPLSRTGNPNDLKNNPNVTFRDYGNGRLENELAFIDENGNVKLKDKKNDPDRAKFIRARQQQVREMIDRGTKEPNDPTFGIRFRDGQRIVAGKTLPPRFDLTRFPAPLKQLARRMETIGNAGETMQVRYFALGKSKDVFKQGDLRNAQAINREVMFVEWQATKDGNINAFVVDLTQFRNRAMKAIAQRDPALAKVNWDFKQLEADLRRVLDNHANGRDGSDGIGPERRNAVNALLGIGTKTNRAANPLTGLGGKGSALKTLRLDAFDDIAGTGRQGFSFDYQKANGNFMPDRPAPRPDLDSDLPVRMPQQIPREAQGMPDVLPDPIEDSARKIHSVYDKSLLAKDRDSALYPKNPVPGSVVLPPRYGLVGNAPGMPRNFTEVRELVKLLADRVEDTGRRDVPFAQKSARFYSDMANEAVSLAEIVDPQSTGTARFNRADEMLRYLALGSQRTNVPVNSTKSAGAAASVVGNFTAGYKMGFGDAQRATRQAQADFKAGKHFNLDMKGVQDKVRTFYINGLSELIEVARKAGDTAAVEMLETRAAKSLKLVDQNTSKLTPEQLAETERILAGKATIDMWDMAAKRVAVPGYILDPKKRADVKQPFEWTQKSKAAKDTIGSPRWNKVAKELGIVSPAELRYQQARSLGIEGNFDWTAETWKTRVDSGAPFAGGDFTTYTGSTDAGLSPGGGGRLYDAQQAIDGLLADELNRRGLASMFGKDKLFARNAQEILWAIEKKDNPILANNDLSLFGDSIQPLKQELQAIAGTGGQRNVRGAQVLDAMERAYTAMAMQEMPFEVATVGTGRTATAINSALAAMKAAGDPDPLARMTAHYANNLADELTGLATEHGMKLQVDSVKTDLGGFTMDDGSYTETPQITAVIRGNTDDTKYLMQVVNEAVEQQGGNLFRRPSVKELYDPAVEKQPVVSFETSQMTTAQRTAFVTDLAKIRDSKGDRIFTGYTPSENGVFVGGQFYNGNFAAAVRAALPALNATMKKHGVATYGVESMIVPAYRSSDQVAPSAFRDAVQKLFYDKAVSGVASSAPTSILQPANVRANLQSRLRKNEAMFAGRDDLDALAKAINESGGLSADQALARVGQSMKIPETKKMQAAFSDYVRGNRKKYEALPAADKKTVSAYIKQAREAAKALRDQEAAFSRAAKEGIRQRRAEIANRYDPQRALDEIDAASLLGYMGDLETVP